mmetsp:Transcript_12800/g.20127  ORF Transcript_12800/g.20127 Transcript_12800/m.20127 type:complete len:195 (+) Transcript_12800:45-629(+)
MGASESKGEDRICGGCTDDGMGFETTTCVKRSQGGPEGERKVVAMQVADSRGPAPQSNGEGGQGAQPLSPHNDPSPRRHYVPQPTPDSWRFNANTDNAVGVGAYFGRIEGAGDSVARVKSLVPGGPAEQTGIIEIGDALCEVDDVDVYGQPLCELGKHVLGPSGSVVKLGFEKCRTGERYVTHLVRGKGVLTVM